MPKRTSGDLDLDSADTRWRWARKPHGRPAIVSRLAAMLMGLVLLAAYTPVVASAAVPQDQAITFDTAPTGAVIGSIGVNVSATATSSLPVAYSATTSSVCSVDASTGSLALTTAGTCTIAADQAGDASWNPAPQVTQDVIVSATIRGTITGPDGTTPVVGALVCAHGTLDWCGSTIAGGAYTTGGLAPGPYTIYVGAPSASSLVTGFYKSGVAGNYTTDPSLASTITVDAADVPGINVTLPQGYRISGTITDSAGTPIDLLGPIAWNVDLCTWADPSSPSHCTGAELSSDGTYTSMDTPPGTYGVLVQHSPGSALVDGWYDSSAGTSHWAWSRTAATQVVLSGVDVPGIDIAVPTGYTISGKITDAAGRPVVRATVWACSTVSCAWGWTASDGTYTTEPFPADSYWVQVSVPDGSSSLGGWYDGSPGTSHWTPNFTTKTVLDVSSADVANIDIAMPVGYTSGGVDVTVVPSDALTGETPATITFGEVTAPGETTVTISTSGPGSSGFSFGSPAQYVDISTTATFTGSVTVCLSYAGVTFGGSGTPALYHYSGGAWHDITTSVDTLNQIICGTTSSLSPFVVGLPTRTPMPTPAPTRTPTPAPAGPGAQTITFGLPASGLAGSTLALAGVATSGLAPTYASTTPAVCSVSGATVSLLAAGTCSVTASQPGDGVNWTAASPVSASMNVTGVSTVVPPILIMVVPPILIDVIARGVNRGTVGFTTTTVVLAKPGYITYLVRLAPSFAGRAVQIWRRSKMGTWTPLTTRLVAADGTVHFFLRIGTWTGLWAKLDGGATHGRVGTVR
jgi:hypothetical protein